MHSCIFSFVASQKKFSQINNGFYFDLAQRIRDTKKTGKFWYFKPLNITYDYYLKHQLGDC